MVIVTLGMPATVVMAAGESCGPNVTWSLDESTGTLYISGSGPMDDYENDHLSIYVTPTPWCSNYYSEKITSIVIADGVTKIGSLAFDDCDCLTDVYWNGTESQWQDVKIGQYGNDALTSATLHCNAVAEEPNSADESVVNNKENKDGGKKETSSVPLNVFASNTETNTVAGSSMHVVVETENNFAQMLTESMTTNQLIKMKVTFLQGLKLTKKTCLQ